MSFFRFLFTAAAFTLCHSLLLAEDPPAPIDGVKKAIALQRLPFRGTVAAVDVRAGTFTFKTRDGKEHVHVLADYGSFEKSTGHAATIHDVKVGEVVRGTRSKLDESRWEVIKLIIGPKEKPATE